MTGGRSQHCDLMLTGGVVVTVDESGAVYDCGAVAVRGDRIVAVGSAEDLAGWQATRTIDCAGKAVLPGFVDGHNHLFQVLARGLGEGMSVVPWLCELMWPYATEIDHDDAVAGARLGAVEAVRAGTTTVIDNHYAPSDLATTFDVADAIEAVGLRGAVARGMVGSRTELAARRGQPDVLFRYSTAEEVDLTRAAMQARPADAKVAIWPAPMNLTYADQDLMVAAVELAREFGTRWHTHCCEDRGDPGCYQDSYGIRPVQWLAKEGLLDQRATLAHGIWLDDREVGLVGAAGAGIAHNPASNGYLASGTARIPDLAAAGASLALGTDGPSCGHRQDLFEGMKLAIFVQRLHTLDPTCIRASDVLAMATREGARYAGVDAGVLAAGKLADLIVVDLARPHLQPVHDIVSTLVYSARGADVVTTIIGGQVVYADDRCVLVDEEQVMAHATEHATTLLTRAGIHTPYPYPYPYPERSEPPQLADGNADNRVA